jgi:hypothetical protein
MVTDCETWLRQRVHGTLDCMDEPRILIFRGDSSEGRRVTDAWVYAKPFYHDGDRHRVTAFHPMVQSGQTMLVTELTPDPHPATPTRPSRSA